MNKNIILGIFIGLFSMQVHAASFGIFDAHSLAMGGVGVASGDASNASHYNPALLAAAHADDDFSLVLPTVIFGASDPNSLADAIDAFGNANYETSVDNAVTTYNASIGGGIGATQTAAGLLSTAISDLSTGVGTLSNKALVFKAGGGVLLAVPSDFIAVSVYSAGRVVGGTSINIASADTALFTDYSTVLACISTAADAAAVIACDTTATDVLDGAGNFNTTDTTGSLQSSINVRGATITETGVSLAHNFDSLGGIAIGVTPKSMTVNTFDSAASLASAEIELDAGTKSYSDTNIDVGVAMKLSDSLKVGVVAKNILAKDYKTVLNNTLNLKTQLRAGVAYQNDWILVAADMDLTENEGFGFEGKSQNAAIGMEMDLFDLFQFRAGYRQNLVNDTAADSGIASVGAGFSPFGVHLDLGVATSNAGIEAGLQLGFKF